MMFMVQRKPIFEIARPTSCNYNVLAHTVSHSHYPPPQKKITLLQNFFNLNLMKTFRKKLHLPVMQVEGRIPQPWTIGQDSLLHVTCRNERGLQASVIQ